jgi:type I restriction enzyme S subunit
VSARELITEHLDLWTGAVTQKSTRGRGGNSTVELTGIKKLRELILQLAIQGKLVPQDSNAEPAAKLLAQINEERNQLIEDGVIKKPPKLKQIEASESPFQIPDSWKFIRLGDAVEIIRGITFPASEKSKSPAPGRVACLRTSNVQDKIEFEDILYIRDSFVSRSSQYINAHDIVMSMANSRELVGKVAIIEAAPEKPTSFGGFLGVLRPIQIHPKFLMAVLRASSTRSTLIDSASQTTNIANISIGKLNPLVIGLPPREEQDRIVQKVDELMALCDRLEQQTSDQLEAHETLVDTLLGTLTQPENATELANNWARLAAHFDTLFTTEQSIDKLKQTVLQLAVMGRLVEQDSGNEPALQLVEQIGSEKQRLIKAKELKKSKEFPIQNTSNLPEIPKSWMWVSLGELISVMDAGWSPACPPQPAEPDAWGVLRTTAVQVMEYLEHENKKLPDSKTPRKQYEVRSGDILITRAGPKNRVGISCIVKKTRPKLMISDKIIRFHLIEAGLSAEYVCLCLNAGETYRHLESAKSGMAESQMNISQDKLKLAPIPLCPAKEQHRIVQKVDELMTLCDQLKERLNQASETRCQCSIQFATPAAL